MFWGFFGAKNENWVMFSDKSIYFFLFKKFAYLCTFQLFVTVHDSAFPDLKDRAEVTITVTRNPNAPIFEPSASYFEQIRENTTVGTEIVDINARDADQVLLNHIFFPV